RRQIHLALKLAPRFAASPEARQCVAAKVVQVAHFGQSRAANLCERLIEKTERSFEIAAPALYLRQNDERKSAPRLLFQGAAGLSLPTLGVPCGNFRAVPQRMRLAERAPRPPAF